MITVKTAGMEDTLAYTVLDAVRVCGLSRRTLYRLFEQGTLKPRKSGNRTIILRSDLEAYLSNLPVGVGERT